MNNAPTMCGLTTDEIETLVAADAKRGAELAAMKADIVEAVAAIDDALPYMEAPKATSAKQRARLEAIAAKYRETDPLIEAIDAVWEYANGAKHVAVNRAKLLRAELAKRGYELGAKP